MPKPKRICDRPSPPRYLLLNFKRQAIAEGTRLQMVRELESVFPVVCEVDELGVVHIDGAEIAYIVPLESDDA